MVLAQGSVATLRSNSGQSERRGNRLSRSHVEPGMGMDSVDRDALVDAGLDPDDPKVWADQRWVSDLLVCYGLSLQM